MYTAGEVQGGTSPRDSRTEGPSMEMAQGGVPRPAIPRGGGAAGHTVGYPMRPPSNAMLNMGGMPSATATASTPPTVAGATGVSPWTAATLPGVSMPSTMTAAPRNTKAKDSKPRKSVTDMAHLVPRKRPPSDSVESMGNMGDGDGVDNAGNDGFPVQYRPATDSKGYGTFSVLDRRLNLDAFRPDASLYSLLRSWVQDDPSRPINFAQANGPRKIYPSSQLKQQKTDTTRRIRKRAATTVSSESIVNSLQHVSCDELLATHVAFLRQLKRWSLQHRALEYAADRGVNRVINEEMGIPACEVSETRSMA
ncbi:unnamed protein product [Chrysoparadoxa australica]